MAPVAPERLEHAAIGRAYGALLCSVGYETRSSAIAKSLQPSVDSIAGVEFHRGHNAIYKRNRQHMDAIGADVRRLDDESFCAWVTGWLSDLAKAGQDLVAVDVSSMSRPRIAGVVQAIMTLPDDARITVDLLYTPARYKPAPQEVPDATEALDPVLPEFAGAPADPEQPLVLVFGLGYEPERAASAVDEFAPQVALPFFPIGSDSRFEIAVQHANQSVLALPDVKAPHRYAISDPFRTFCDLEVLVQMIQAGHLADTAGRPARPLLLPLGPKIFAATCMLVAASASTPVPVWRVSSGIFGSDDDRESSGELVTLRVSTAPISLDPPQAPALEVLAG